MKKRILAYLARMDGIIKEDAPDTDWQAVLEEHLTQIAFFQHERLIHLIVTVAFAIVTFMVMLTMTITFSFWLAILLIPLIILLAPYISHYYLLENGVQKMYEQYDAMRTHITG